MSSIHNFVDGSHFVLSVIYRKPISNRQACVPLLILNLYIVAFLEGVGFFQLFVRLAGREYLKIHCHDRHKFYFP